MHMIKARSVTITAEGEIKLDIFKKCYGYSLANDLREKGIYPYFHALETRQDTEVIMTIIWKIRFGSKN